MAGPAWLADCATRTYPVSAIRPATYDSVRSDMRHDVLPGSHFGCSAQLETVGCRGMSATTQGWFSRQEIGTTTELDMPLLACRRSVRHHSRIVASPSIRERYG